MLTLAVAEKPHLEIALFSGLALVPFSMARWGLLARTVKVVLRQLSSVIGIYRGRFSVFKHIVREMRTPMEHIIQTLLHFIAVNLLVNAIPDDFEVAVPKLLRFLDANGDGTLEAAEVEDFFYRVSTRVLKAFVMQHLMLYLIAVKRPPPGWRMSYSEQRRQEVGELSILERYWVLTSSQTGWWTLLDRVLTGCLYLAVCFSWLTAVGIDARMVTAAGGAGGLAVGLAAQQVVGNGVAGLILLATGPCKVGDRVEMAAADLRGVVKKIGWNSTAVQLESGDLVYIPNSQLLETPLVVRATNDTEQGKAAVPGERRVLGDTMAAARAVSVEAEACIARRNATAQTEAVTPQRQNSTAKAEVPHEVEHAAEHLMHQKILTQVAVAASLPSASGFRG